MLHHRCFLFALPLALVSFGALGCAGNGSLLEPATDDASADAIAHAEPRTVPTSSPLYGTWTGENTIGRFSSLTLMTDQRYHLVKPVICFRAPCDPIVEDGEFSLLGRDLHNFIVLGDPASPDSPRYEYALSDGNLRIRPLYEGAEWFVMTPSGSAWCETSCECNLQNLPPGVCAGNYACEQNACNWRCAIAGQTSAVDPRETTAQ